MTLDLPALRKLHKSIAFWAVEMERSADAMADAGAPVTVVDGNRIIASTLREVDAALPALLRAAEERDALLAAAEEAAKKMRHFEIDGLSPWSCGRTATILEDAIRLAKEPR